MNLTLDKISIKSDLSFDSSRDNLDKDSKVITIFSLDINRQINKSSSLSDSLLNLVSSQFELIKRGDTISTLNILYIQLYFLREISDIFLSIFDIGQTDLKNSSLEEIINLLSSSGFLNTSPSNILS